MKIGMVLDRPFPVDDRVEKEALSLIEAGFEVHLLCLMHSHQQPSEEDYKGIKVHRFYMPLWFFKKFSPLILTIPVYASIWKKKILEFIRQNEIQVLHVHDLPLVGTALKIKQQMGIHIIADLHENYPQFIEISRHTNTFLGKLLIPKKKWHRVETLWLKEVDAVICVVQEMQTRLLNKGIKQAEYIIVPNTIDLDHLLAQQQKDPAVLKKYQTGFKILFWGRFDTARGLETLIEAGKILKEKIPDFKIILVGDGSLRPALEKMTENLDLRSQVIFEGWQPMSKLSSYLEVSDVAVIPHYKSVQTDNSSPNKLFQFMAFGKAIVASNCDSIARVIREADCGLIFKSGDANDLAHKILELWQNRELSNKLAANGRRALYEKYQWKQTIKTLIGYYRNLELQIAKQE